jgi:outer membrane protein insertion porin family
VNPARVRGASRILLLLSAVGGGARAQAQAPSAEPLHGARIAGVEVLGGSDAPEQIQAFVASFVPTGSRFIEAPDLDRVGTPVSTVPRLVRAFDRLGYHAVVDPTPSPASAASGRSERDVWLKVHLRAYDRLRHIFVSGNWPLRQDEIVRRIGLRPGQALPMPGPERDERVEQERQKIVAFLHDRGYFDARVAIDLQTSSGVPAAVSFHVRIDRGAGYPVGTVRVEGNRAIPSDEIADQFRHYWWLTLWTWPLPLQLRLFNEDKDKIVQRYRLLGYADARLRERGPVASGVDRERKRVDLVLDVTERKRIEVAYEGNERFDADDLRDVITIFTRGKYDNTEIDTSAESIAQHYRGKGHMFVRVRWRREPISREADRIIFTIEEGPSLKVRSVEFVGNRALSRGTLEEISTVKAFPLLGALGIGEGGYASLRQLELNEERIAGHYQSIGYPETRVRCEIAPGAGAFQPVRTVRGDDPRWKDARDLLVRFVVEEGPLVRVAQIRFEPTPGEPLPVPEDFVLKSLRQQPGAAYQPSLIREDVEQIDRILGDFGHPNGSAEPVVTRDGNVVRLVWQIKAGPLTKVSSVFVRGNFHTGRSAILQWIPLEPGSVLRTTEVEHGQRNLALIQLFNNANPVSFPDEARSGGAVPMIVEVEERHDHFGVLRFGGGISTEQATPAADLPVGGYLSAGYEHRNLLGRGWTFLGRGQYGNSLREVRADFLNQRLLGTTFRLELGGSYRRQETLRLGDTRTGEGSIGLARLVYPGVDATIRYSLRDTFHTESLLRGAGANQTLDTVQIGTTVGALGLSLDWQRLDNPLVPSRGFRITAGAELALPEFSFSAGDDAFVKTQLRSFVVVPLTARWSLRHTARYDQGFPLGGRSVIPKVERFFAGGDTTVRGYDLDRVRTQVVRPPPLQGFREAQYRPIGGSLRLLQSAELQVLLSGPLHAALFLDSGIVADSFVTLEPVGFRHGVGVAPIVMKLPIGDVSLAWAWPIDPQAGDSRIGRLHVNVGLMF